MGSKSMEFTIQEDLDEFLQEMKNKEGTSICSSQLFVSYVINSLWAIVMSKRLDPEKSKYFDFLIQDRLLGINSTIAQLAFYMPWIETVVKVITFGKVVICKERVDTIREVYAFMGQQLEKHATTWTKNQPRDVADAYFDKMDDAKDDPSSCFHESHAAIEKCIGDLFLAGVETTSSTLEWSINFLARYPDVQRKLQTEIDTVVGRFRSPSLSDKQSMPYTDAVLYEVLRMSSIGPLGLPHRAMEDFSFQGYHIPKGTMLIALIYGCHYDPDVWGDPEVFRPERWLGAEGAKLKGDRMINFASGKRVCPGEALARDQIWLYLTCIFQRFSVSFDGPTPPISAHLGLLLVCSAFRTIFKSRM